MAELIKKIYPFLDGLIIVFMSMFAFTNFIEGTKPLIFIILWFLVLTITMLYIKQFYEAKNDKLSKQICTLFESIAVVFAITAILVMFSGINYIAYILLTIAFAGMFLGIILVRVITLLISRFLTRTKNVLIVGAGQDGKLIAEEIQQHPELHLNVVGFLDDNMNNLEDEDSSIPILGLTCDSEAVIKDNNVKVVIIAVKSRMDSNILTDLVRGIPLGVKVWRMYRFYEKITHKFLVSKMSVNWLFYDCVRKKALFYAYVKRLCDIVASILILILTLPLTIISIIGIELSDLGPVFFTQTRIGKFGKPFKMIKFRIMYQDEVEDDFDDDVTEVRSDDKRMMPFCRILRKFHIDEIPQMINVLKGEMSIIGPRPVREEVFEENKASLPFWECRNWVRPGWCGWQQLIVNDPPAEERLGLDLYYIKHRHLWWEFAIFIKFLGKVIIGKARNK
ncbi:sugar transferase [bacterium]|nr:sugar transferase [bacterium]